jgi:hypothetical protein
MHQFGFITRIYRDARTTKPNYQLIRATLHEMQGNIRKWPLSEDLGVTLKRAAGETINETQSCK